MVGIIGTSSSLSRGYHNWLAANPDKAKAQVTPTMNMVGFRSPLTPGPLTHGEFGAWLDAEMRRRHYAAFQPWADDSDTPDVIANADDWAAHAAHVVHTVGAAHVGIGLDMVGGRSCVPRDATGYPALLAAISRRMNAADVERVAQANWLRILGDVL